MDGITRAQADAATAAELERRATINKRHLQFLIWLGLVIVFLLISAGLQFRYAWPIWVADGEYIIAGMVLVGAASAIYNWPWGHGQGAGRAG